MVRVLVIFSILILFFNFNNAFSHILEGEGFKSGITHPFMGFDHFLCMLAIGVWGKQMGGRSIWILPIVFPLIMGIGIYIGVLPNRLYIFQELEIALSLTVIGLAIAFNFKPKVIFSILTVSFFAIFHGYAHGMEFPLAENPNLFLIGSMIGTSIIHIIGIGLGHLIIQLFKKDFLRVFGILVALSSLYYITIAFSYLFT